MKTALLSPLLLITTLCFPQVLKKSVVVPEFRAVYVNSNFTVYLKQTNTHEVSLEAEKEILDLTTVFVDNGVLMVNTERKPDSQSKSIWAKIDDIKIRPVMKVFVSAKNIHELQVNGGGKIVSENSLSSPNLSLLLSGSGGMDVDVKGNMVRAEVSGSGALGLRGYASTLTASVSGPGSFNGFNCPVETATVRVTGSGTAEVNVTDSIEAQISGSGAIKHKGNTKSVVQKVYGSGTVARAY